MTSPLENKLNASMQSPRRSTSANTATTEKKEPAARATTSKAKPSDDLNAGTGRELNPQRIWPD